MKQVRGQGRQGAGRGCRWVGRVAPGQPRVTSGASEGQHRLSFAFLVASIILIP